MDPIEFRRHVKRQVAPAWNGEIDGQAFRWLLQGTLGLASELQELRDAIANDDQQKVKEEVSDVWFYWFEILMVLRVNAWGDHLMALEPVTIQDSRRFAPVRGSEWLDQATEDAAYLCGLVEKVVCQSHDLKTHCRAIGGRLREIADFLITLGDPIEFWELNVAKLKRRYPDGFSPEDSIGRADWDHDGDGQISSNAELEDFAKGEDE